MSTSISEAKTAPVRRLDRGARMTVGGLAACAAIAAGVVLFAQNSDDSIAVPAPRPQVEIGSAPQIELHPNINQRDAAERYHHRR